MNSKIKYTIVVVVVIIIIAAGAYYYIASSESHFGFPSQSTVKGITGNSYNVSKVMSQGPAKNTTKTEIVYYNTTGSSPSTAFYVYEAQFNNTSLAKSGYKTALTELPAGIKFIMKNQTYNGFEYSVINASNASYLHAYLGFGYKKNMAFLFLANISLANVLKKIAYSIIDSMTSVFGGSYGSSGSSSGYLMAARF